MNWHLFEVFWFSPHGVDAVPTTFLPCDWFDSVCPSCPCCWAKARVIHRHRPRTNPNHHPFPYSPHCPHSLPHFLSAIKESRLNNCCHHCCSYWCHGQWVDFSSMTLYCCSRFHCCFYFHCCHLLEEEEKEQRGEGDEDRYCRRRRCCYRYVLRSPHSM